MQSHARLMLSVIRMNDLPQSYWVLGSQFLRLAHESCLEIIEQGNSHFVTSSKPISSEEYSQRVRWSDHSVGTAVLFSYYHGVELLLKGFLSAGGVSSPHHRLTELLSKVKVQHSGTEFVNAVEDALHGYDKNTPLGKFLSENAITIDDWYEALKYPESRDGTRFDHFPLKYGQSQTIPFWRSIYVSSANIHKQCLALSREHGFT